MRKNIINIKIYNLYNLKAEFFFTPNIYIYLIKAYS